MKITKRAQDTAEVIALVVIKAKSVKMQQMNYVNPKEQ